MLDKHKPATHAPRRQAKIYRLFFGYRIGGKFPRIKFYCPTCDAEHAAAAPEPGKHVRRVWRECLGQIFIAEWRPRFDI